ncbi:MAG: acyl-CoA dehydrogenase family protein [Acidimicrobiales bacterium]
MTENQHESTAPWTEVTAPDSQPSSDSTLDASPSEVSALDAMLDAAHPIKMAMADLAARFAMPADTTTFDSEAWAAAAEAGILGLLVDPEYGGQGRSIVEALLAFEGLGLGTGAHGTVFALASQVFAMQRALADAGSAAQLERWLPSLVDGSAIGAFAMTEPGAGSDTAGITTLATPTGDDSWTLSGTKTWVTLAPQCDVLIVFATTDPTKGRWAQTAFLIESDRNGVEVGPAIPKSGLAGCPFAEVHLHDVAVTIDDVLGKVGAGGSVFSNAVDAERAFLYAAQLGAMERTLDLTISRARTRHQSGQQIGKYQAVSHRIAEMKLRHESARLLVYKAAALHESGRSITMAGALAKLAASEAAVQSAIDAISVHGAEGYTLELGLESDLRNAIGGLAYSGTSDIQRNIVAGLLSVDRPRRR